MIEYNDFIEYVNTKVRNYGTYSYSEYIEKIPANIRDILKSENIIRPKHLSFEASRTLLINMAVKISPEFIIDNSNYEIIDLITKYLISDKSFVESNSDYNVYKGLMIMGSLGSGKTVILKAISAYLKSFSDTDYNYDPSYNILPTHRIIANFIKYGYEYFDNPQLTGDNILSENIGIDDIGAENKINYYGTSINVIGELILRRYEKYQSQRKGKILCTTNLNGDQLRDFYGERIHDRLVELVNPIVLTGNSRRK